MLTQLSELTNDQKEGLREFLRSLQKKPLTDNEIEILFGHAALMNQKVMCLDNFLIRQTGIDDRWVWEVSEQGEDFIEGYRNEGLDIQMLIEITGYLGVARKYCEQNPVLFTDTKQWWVWDRRTLVWKGVDETDILLSLNKISNWSGIVNSKVKAQLLEAFRLVGRDNFNNLKPVPTTWIQFNREIIDFSTGETKSPSPEYFVVNRIPWKLGASTDTPTIDKLFTDWVGPEQVPLMHELFAYCCLTDYPIHRLFCFLGEGRNGKSTALNLLKKFIGIDNVIKTDLDRIKASPRFEMARLDNKLVCLLGEANNEKFDRTDAAKSATGGDPITLEYKGSNTAKTTTLYAKWIMGTNQMPYTSDLSLGWGARWVILQFQSVFKKCKDVLSTIPEQELENLALKATKILPSLIERGEFSGEKSFEEKMKQMDELSDPISAFIKKKCVEDFDGVISKNDFIQKFDLYCRKHGVKKWNYGEINASLEGRDFESARRRILGKENAVACWTGLSWKDDSCVDCVRSVRGSNFTAAPIGEVETPDTTDTTDTKIKSTTTKVTQITTEVEKKEIVTSKPSQIQAAQILFNLITQSKPLEGNNLVALESEWENLKAYYDLPDFEGLVSKLERETKIFRPRAGFIDTI